MTCLTQTLGSGQQLQGVADRSVDAIVIVMDPPDYDDVQYSELLDFYYVRQKRSLGDLYPATRCAPSWRRRCGRG